MSGPDVTNEDGKRYGPRSKSVDLSKHLGHKVSVTGTKMLEENEAKEKHEAGAKGEDEPIHIDSRDAFAVELLLAGVPIERVSILLGHQSVRITEKHYAPWVSSRQEQLEADLAKAWSRDPLVALESQGTPGVHGRIRRPNQLIHLLKI